MNKKNHVTIFSWRHAIQEAGLPSTTKFVLLNLSIYMNDRGEGCFPSIEKQMNDTGLSNKTICKHIDIACEAGFLCKNKHGYGGQKWARNEYRALMPLVKVEDGSQLNQLEGKKGSVPSTPPCKKRQCTSFQKAVYLVHTNSSYNSPFINKKNYIKKREDENCEDGSIFENSDQNELQGNLSKHSEIEPSFQETKGKSLRADKVEDKQNLMVSKQAEQSPKANGYSQDFQEFWNLYPVKASNNGGAATKGSKKTAYRAWLKAFKDNNNLTLNEIKIGLQNYEKFLYGCPASGQRPCFQANKHASTWINASGWEDEYTTTSKAAIRNPEQAMHEQAMYEEAFEGLDEIMRRERESAKIYEAFRGMRSV